jgi:hypothetical protein
MEEILKVTMAALNLDVRNIMFSFGIKSVIAMQSCKSHYKSVKIDSATVM